MAGRKPAPRRCAICGEFLPGAGHECAAHPGEMTVPWTQELATAYRVQSDLIREGKEPLKLTGLPGNRFDLAARYVRRWEQREGAA